MQHMASVVPSVVPVPTTRRSTLSEGRAVLDVKVAVEKLEESDRQSHNALFSAHPQCKGFYDWLKEEMAKGHERLSVAVVGGVRRANGKRQLNFRTKDGRGFTLCSSCFAEVNLPDGLLVEEPERMVRRR